LVGSEFIVFTGRFPQDRVPRDLALRSSMFWRGVVDGVLATMGVLDPRMT
jgi:hypothetical protein